MTIQVGNEVWQPVQWAKRKKWPYNFTLWSITLGEQNELSRLNLIAIKDKKSTLLFVHK